MKQRIRLTFAQCKLAFIISRYLLATLIRDKKIEKSVINVKAGI